MKLSKEDYIIKMEKHLSDCGSSKIQNLSDVVDIVAKIDNSCNLENCFSRCGWKTIMKNFMPENLRGKKIYFYNSGFSYNALAIETDPGSYVVTFSFLRDNDVMDHDYKKYLLYNLITNKYTYTVKSSCYINAISMAFNRNKEKFIKRYHDVKLIPELSFKENHEPDVVQCPCVNMEDPPPEYMLKPYEYYEQARQRLIQNGYNNADIRFYTLFDDISAMVLHKENKFICVFSFMNPEDMTYVQAYGNDGNYKHIARYCVINKYFENKHTYEYENTRNSIMTVYYAFNDHSHEFPSRFKDTKIKIELRPYIKENVEK